MYVLTVTERDGVFTASATKGDSRERFGIETTGATAAEATDKLTRWLEWQREHTQALEALQQAERVYHRALADAAFGSAEGTIGGESRESLDAVDAARVRLDDVRARRPSV
ncbi:MAG: hypothetical protein QM736_24200 [Vicinamibacterales bacterium]